MTIIDYVREKAETARAAARNLSILSSAVKNSALIQMADALMARAGDLKTENEKDIAGAEKRGLTTAMVDRLRLTDKRIGEMCQGLREVAALPDPVGEVLKMWRRPNGMQIGRV
ncbi:MAG TPA: gamma-glutamyl-phosphate reductase, partial [Nitrospiria bacterium]